MSDKSNPVAITLLLWLVLATTLILNALGTGGLSLSTDDAMRLAETRDLLAGQSWFDTTQWRMNAPYGLPMHWSHLVDAGLGGTILFFHLFANPKTAETLALYVWPLLLLLPSLLAIARIGSRLAGRTGGLLALLLGASCSVAMAPFRPGSIDHDNVQLALTLWMIALLLEFDRSRWAAAGVAILASVSLAVGMQTLPYVVVALLAIALWWISQGKTIAQQVGIFGIVFAVANVVLLGGATASAYRFAASCDTYSGFYATLGIAGGCGLATITFAPLNNATHRAFAFIAFGCVLLALAGFVGPSCLRGPYAALDPRLGPVWFSRIEEVQSPFTLASQAPGDFLAGYFYAVLAMLASFGAVFLAASEDRRAGLTVAGFVTAGVLVTSLEIRGLDFAQMYAMPAVAAFVALAISRSGLSAGKGAVATVAGLIVASNASFAVAATAIENALPKDEQFDAVQESWIKACLSEKGLAALNGLPKGRVLSLVDQGPYILIYTKDSAVAGPYHRDASGILDTYDVFTTAPANSRTILAQRGIDYITVCKPAPDYAFYRAHDGGKGILSLLAKGQKIAWLDPVASPGNVEIYRVR